MQAAVAKKDLFYGDAIFTKVEKCGLWKTEKKKQRKIGR